ncbi:39S ribosomal protein S30, mitochondrial [Ornithorhynchus anatinus]|uniref:Mitochondrial ribosomal protein S30 n=1 Tax=Ornithorhynchus anatinus TaxID=9258 RepID=F7GCW5_ORNAN|nr:39S ribosomal protein S30, mitochondrial [Ornithorhynchus anatinus]
MAARGAAAAVAAVAARYPPLVASPTAASEAGRRRRVERWRRAVQAAGAASDRLRLFTRLQRPKLALHPQTAAPGADRWYQSFTKTVFRPGLPPALPPPSPPRGPDLDLPALRAAARHGLLQEHVHLRRARRAPPPGPRERAARAPWLAQLLAALAPPLAALNPHLAAAALDFKQPVHFYWLRGEEVVPRGHRRGRIDARRFQIDDRPHSQIRMSKQLPEFVALDEFVPEEIPVINCSPNKLPMFKRQYENKIFIGTKLADPCCYGHTQFHLLPDNMERSRLVKENRADQIEVGFRANAIASLFAWTGAQAMYQGFWSEADVTRPFVSQAVVTDGKYFAFFCYQLNTLALTVEADRNNPRKNICWGTESMPLYDTIENEEVKGFNDEVLLQIIQFLLNRPKENESEVLKT